MTCPTTLDIQILDQPVEPLPFDPFPQPAGAESVFLGRTREETHPTHGPLRRLSYETYRPMAQRVLSELAEQAASRFEALAIRIHHAVGDVPPGDASVLVQTVCGHRDQSFAACRFLIDQLKKQAPIWKREEWSDGTTWSEGVAVAPPNGDLP